VLQTTKRLSNLLNDQEKNPNVILEIDGLENLLSVRDVLEVVTFDNGVPIPVGTVFGSARIKENVRKIIAIDGTTATISQTVEPDKSGGQATSSINVRLIDVNQYATRLVSPKFELADILYRKAKFYIGLSEGYFPKDYNLTFSGVITSIKSFPDYVDLTISHPDEIKRTEIFKKVEAKLVAPANFFSATIGSLLFIRRSDYDAPVDIVLINSGPPSGSVSVSGGTISIFGNNGVTTWQQVKRNLDASSDAMDLVSVVMVGSRTATFFSQSSTPLVSDSSLLLDNVEGFLLPAPPIFRTCVKINDEIIEYTGIDTVNNELTGCTRALFNSIGKRHAANDTVQTFYVLGDATGDESDALELMKYILMSKGPEWYLEEFPINDIASLPSGLSQPDAIFFRDKFLSSIEGVQVGDTLEISNAINPSNDGVYEIEQVTEFENGTFVQLDSTLTSESPSTALARFKSKYNALPDGAGVLPSQIDLNKLSQIKTRQGVNIARYQFFLKDTMQVKKFIDEELLFPSGMYSVPRQGKISAQFTEPAIFESQAGIWDKEAIINPQNIVIERGTGKLFYNTVIYKFEQDSITDKFLRGTIKASAESFERIKAPTKALTIESQGMRDNIATVQLIERNVDRLFNRYRFGAEAFNVRVLFQFGSQMEVGDAVLIGDLSFPIIDSTRGVKEMRPRIYEIVDKKINWRTCEVEFRVIDTTYGANRRFGLFSPTSACDTGSTSSFLKLRKEFFPDVTKKEVEKWQNYLGQHLLVRSSGDWDTSTNTVVVIQGFDFTGEGGISIAPSLPFTPSAQSIIQLPRYSGPSITPQLMATYKSRYVFWTPTIPIVNVINSNTLDVGTNFSKIFVGSLIRIHDEDYSIDSGDINVIGKTGTQITISPSFPLANTSCVIDLVGFASDRGAPYTWT
jgi:hypothetical protein